MHLPSRQSLRDALASPAAKRLSPQARERLAWIAHFVEHGASVTETCARFGIARATFHRWLERFDVRDLTSLEDRPPEHAPRGDSVAPAVRTLIRAYRQAEPLLGKQQISERLRIDHNLSVSSSTVGRIIEQECLYFAPTPLHWRKRHAHAERTAPSTDRTLLPVPEAASACPCFWCRFQRRHWPLLRRHIALTSVLANVALIGLFAWTILWERARADADPPPLPASVTYVPALTPSDAP